MVMNQRDVRALVGDQLMPAYLAEREHLDRIDKWWRWEHDRPTKPSTAGSDEYRELIDRAQTPWLNLVVTSVAQALYVDGYRTDDGEDALPWQWWEANKLDGRQVALHRSAIAYGLGYAVGLPGENSFGDEMPIVRAVSPRRMTAFYDEPEYDDWPHFTMQADPVRMMNKWGHSEIGWSLQVLDEESVYFLRADSMGGDVEFFDAREHGVGVCPVVRFANQLDTEGRAPGEVEPFIPMAGRIDQTVADRLIVQRFASWVVKTISGMDIGATSEATGLTTDQVKMKLAIEDILVAKDPDTRFGSLPASPLEGFIKAVDTDIRQLAAVSQTPAHEMLGQMANLSADALAAARASLTAKVEERQQAFGASWKQTFRLMARIMGDDVAARDMSASIHWRDTEIRSLNQAADALGKIAAMLGMPVQVLWEKIPGFTQQEIERAKNIAEQNDPIGGLLAELASGQTSQLEDPADLKAKADAMGVLIRSGVDPVSAAQQAGLAGVTFTGAVPVSLRQPEVAATRFED